MDFLSDQFKLFQYQTFNKQTVYCSIPFLLTEQIFTNNSACGFINTRRKLKRGCETEISLSVIRFLSAFTVVLSPFLLYAFVNSNLTFRIAFKTQHLTLLQHQADLLPAV